MSLVASCTRYVRVSLAHAVHGCPELGNGGHACTTNGSLYAVTHTGNDDATNKVVGMGKQYRP